MSNIIPPLLSNSPPPPPTNLDDEEDDDFGDFTAGGFDSITCYDADEDFSPTASPQKFVLDHPSDNLSPNLSHNDDLNQIDSSLDISKDYCDKRKLIGPLDDDQINTTDTKPDSDSKLKNLVIETTCDKQNTLSDHHKEYSVELNQSIVNSIEEIDDFTVISSDCGMNNIESCLPLETVDALSTDDSEQHCDTSVNSSSNNPDAFHMEKNDETTAEDDFNEFYSFDDKTSSDSDRKQFDPKNTISNYTQQSLNDDEEFSEFISKIDENNFGDFTAFEIATRKDVEQTEVELHSNTNSLDDDDFGDFESTNVIDDTPLAKLEEINNLINQEVALEKSNHLFKEIFTSDYELEAEYKNNGASVKNDKLFEKIKDVTDTHALKFHWPKSTCQNLLLNALNIDARNVLVGAGWNPSMPRFAANLSTVPLEPTKTEATVSAAAVPVEQSDEKTVSLDLENLSNTPVDRNYDLVKFLDIQQFHSHPHQNYQASVENLSPPKRSPNPSANDVFDNNWDAWLQTTSGELSKTQVDKVEIVEKPSITRTTTIESIPPPPQLTTNDDFDDFVSCAPAPPISITPAATITTATAIPHNILLRETHISNTSSRTMTQENGGGGGGGGGSGSSEMVNISWLEPTIVTPELSRKEHQFTVDTDEEFDDFHIVMPVEVPAVNKIKRLAPELSQTVVKSNTLKSEALQDDDDFGDFTFSLPKETTTTQRSLNSIPATSIPSHFTETVLEPLKPDAVVGSTASVCNGTAVQLHQHTISWPDPGITDDEIKRFETLSYSRVSENGNQTEKSNNSPEKLASDDENSWSEFVSVKKCPSTAVAMATGSPIHKLKSNEQQRSFSPDLPLSVLNLGSIQPVKQPVPVITPNGLVQTELSSTQQNNCLSLNLPNLMIQNNHHLRSFSVGSRGGSQNLMNHHNRPPSIISSQYANQAYSSFNHHQQSKNVNDDDDDDDEWSDFVSHKQSKSINSHYWSVAPNIISNPNYNNDNKLSKKQNHSNPMAATSTISSLPDLDFFMPQNRGNRK